MRRVNVTNVHITNINVTNINVTNIQYRNQRVNGAMTAVPQDQFAGSRRIGRGATVVNVNDARNVRIVGDGAPVTPTQQSVLIRRQNTTTPVSRPPESAQNRQVVWKNTPPPRRTTFASHADQLTTTGDKPVVPPTIAQTRGAPRSGVARSAPATRAARTVATDTHRRTEHDRTTAPRFPPRGRTSTCSQYPREPGAARRRGRRVAPAPLRTCRRRSRVPNSQPDANTRPAAPVAAARATRVRQCTPTGPHREWLAEQRACAHGRADDTTIALHPTPSRARR